MQLEAKRWTRYGKDRVYVAAPDSSRVGWLDLLTQEQHLEQSALSGEFTIAVEPYLSSTGIYPPPRGRHRASCAASWPCGGALGGPRSASGRPTGPC